jgi:4-oxalocrotonate tautomerase
MPEVFVHAVEGRTPEQKRALMKEITDTVVRNFDAPPEAVVVTIVESPKVNQAKAGVCRSPNVDCGWRHATRPPA